MAEASQTMSFATSESDAARCFGDGDLRGRAGKGFAVPNRQRDFGGAGRGGRGRRGGRVGLGVGGAGAVLRRSQPSRFWREPRPLIRSPDSPA